MCESTIKPTTLLVIRSVTLLESGKRCCDVNNGKPHSHCIKAENQRRERLHIRGTVATRSVRKQMDFMRAGRIAPDWQVDFLAYGQRLSDQKASLQVIHSHSPSEDIIADLEYKFDDPFSAGYRSAQLVIQVKL